MTKQTAKKIEMMKAERAALEDRRRAIEAGVEGSCRNPSDDDRAPGRICYSDVMYAKSEAAAQEWEAVCARYHQVDDKICKTQRRARQAAERKANKEAA